MYGLLSSLSGSKVSDSDCENVNVIRFSTSFLPLYVWVHDTAVLQTLHKFRHGADILVQCIGDVGILVRGLIRIYLDSSEVFV